MRWLLLGSALVGIALCRRFIDPTSRSKPARPAYDSEEGDGLVFGNSDVPMNSTEYWFDVPIDHFAYANNKTFKIRYRVNMDSYKPGGPIFFYTGNEGNLESFIKATGMMWDLAPKFNAVLVFAEHRYYGQSKPFGDDDFKDTDHMAFLTSAQALADYADLIYYLKSSDGHQDNSPSFDPKTKIIAFGGSYGGMLSAWFRIKYPHLVVGVWASSAPLKYFNGGGVDWGAFDAVTTRTFSDSGANPNNVRNGWLAIKNLSTTDEGRKFLNQRFNIKNTSLITSPTGGDYLVAYVREAIEYMAMVDYPYPTNFLEPMPGFPVRAAAQYLSGDGPFSDEALATMLYNASLIYYNYKNDDKYEACIDPNVCGDPGTAQLGDALGWPWQECTEIVVEMCARANTSFFLEECHKQPLDVLYETCDSMFTTLGWSRPMMHIDGVRNLYGLDISQYSNMILTQGHLDPWSVGGYKKGDPGVDDARGIYVVEIEGSAHHLDLRTPNHCDGNTIHNARFQIVNILECWLTDGCKNPKLQDLPAFVDNSDKQCGDWVNGYPWGQGGGDSTTTAATTTANKNLSSTTTTASTQAASGKALSIVLLSVFLRFLA